MTTPYPNNPYGGGPWPPQPPYGPPPVPPQQPYGPPPVPPPYAAAPPQPGPWMPPAGAWWGPPPPVPPRRRKQVWLYAVLAVVVITVASAVAAIAAYDHYQNSDPARIKALIGAFSDSVSRGNPQEIATLMCREEAEPYLDAAADPGGELANAPKPKFRIGDIVVHGDAASATLIFRDDQTQTMYFRKNAGKWTVCAPAKDQM